MTFDYDEPETNEPFWFRIWDVFVFTAFIACFATTWRLVGVAAIALLPGFLIAPAVLVNRENSVEVKVGFCVAILVLTILFFVSQ